MPHINITGNVTGGAVVQGENNGVVNVGQTDDQFRTSLAALIDRMTASLYHDTKPAVSHETD